MIILLLLGTPVKAITYDYRTSENELLPEKESRMKEIRSIGLDEHFATCPEDWVEKMEVHLNEKYGGIRKYCRSIGYSEEEEKELLQILQV
jgi:protein-tyrosine phosphatase